jgi:hypothetical protein
MSFNVWFKSHLEKKEFPQYSHHLIPHSIDSCGVRKISTQYTPQKLMLPYCTTGELFIQSISLQHTLWFCSFHHYIKCYTSKFCCVMAFRSFIRQSRLAISADSSSVLSDFCREKKYIN